RDGAAGDVIMIKAARTASADLPHDSSSADWFFDAKRSGDVIVEMSVHNLDECNWVTVSYDYVNGIKLSYAQMFFHPAGMPGGGQPTYVYGTKGAVDLDNATAYSL